MEVTKKNREKVEKSQSVYIVARWAKWGVQEYGWTGKWSYYMGTQRMNPVVYYYNDHNGEYEEYQEIDVFYTTTGQIFMWTFDKWVANTVAQMLNEREANENHR